MNLEKFEQTAIDLPFENITGERLSPKVTRYWMQWGPYWLKRIVDIGMSDPTKHSPAKDLPPVWDIYRSKDGDRIQWEIPDQIHSEMPKTIAEVFETKFLSETAETAICLTVSPDFNR